MTVVQAYATGVVLGFALALIALYCGKRWFTQDEKGDAE